LLLPACVMIISAYRLFVAHDSAGSFLDLLSLDKVLIDRFGVRRYCVHLALVLLSLGIELSDKGDIKFATAFCVLDRSRVRLLELVELEIEHDILWEEEMRVA
jgi:hypothetical protein